MLFLLCFVLALVIGAVHLYRDKQPRTNARVAEILLLWLLVICVGVASVLTFIADAFFAGATPYMDILVPIVLIALLTYGKRAGRDERERIGARG